MRLFEHLRSLGMSNAAIRGALESGKVRLHGVPTGDGGRDLGGLIPSVDPRAPRLTPGRDVALIWYDDSLVVAWKPSGLLSVPAPGRGRERNLLGEVARVCHAALPVHRLDQDTSGLVMVALRVDMQQQLKDLLERHVVERRYLALVQGEVAQRPFTLRSHLVRDRGDGRRGSLERHLEPDAQVTAKEAITEVRCLERLPTGVSLVEATLHTGRTHQVRVQLAEAGFPVLGDTLYGPPSVSRKGPRLALHAAVLGFEHPRTGEKLRFEAPLADDLERYRRHLLDRGAEQRKEGGRT